MAVVNGSSLAFMKTIDLRAINLVVLERLRIKNDRLSLSDIYKKSQKHMALEMRNLGFRCVSCGGHGVTPENLKQEDFSELARCFDCQPASVYRGRFVRAITS